MFNGFYKELEDLRLNGSPEADFGFLENVPVGESYNLYDFLHGHCDEFAAALSDYYGYSIEYVLDNSNNLIHAYCVTEACGEVAYVDARGITTDAELFFDEFADWCTYEEDDGVVYDSDGECRVLSHKDTREMYSDENREFNQDKDLVGFFQDNSSYYDVRLIERDNIMSDIKVVSYAKGNGSRNEFESSVLAQLKEKGFDISKIELVFQQFIDDKHKDVIWYGGPVAYVDYKGYTFSLEAHGDVSVILFSNEQLYEVEYYYKNKNNTGAYQDEEALKYFVDDSHFKGLNNDSRLEWQNNNWFEMFVETPEGIRECIDVCSFNNIDECIVEMVEMMDEFLLEREQKLSVEQLIADAKVTCEDVNKESMNKSEIQKVLD